MVNLIPLKVDNRSKYAKLKGGGREGGAGAEWIDDGYSFSRITARSLLCILITSTYKFVAEINNLGSEVELKLLI